MKKVGIVCILLGAVLSLAALLLYGYNKNEDLTAASASEDVVSQLQEQIQHLAEDASSEERDEASDEEMLLYEADAEAAPTDMPVVLIDGYEYIGFLTIEAIDLQLPIMSQWDYGRLRLAPCRQFGSIATNDLVIAGHNYVSHFASLQNLHLGDAVVFTDVNGVQYRYEIAKMETIDPTDVEAVEYSGYALVLYTCTYGGQQRTTIFCDRVD